MSVLKCHAYALPLGIHKLYCSLMNFKKMKFLAFLRIFFLNFRFKVSFPNGNLNISCSTEPALRRGDSVYLVGLSRSLQATSRKSIVTNPCAALNIGSADCPRYRATNMEVIELDTGTLFPLLSASSPPKSTIL